jgi:hypothetical protein
MTPNAPGNHDGKSDPKLVEDNERLDNVMLNVNE